jgi:hypothetical protein
MLVVTTNDIPGWEIQRVCGEVFGLTVRSRNALCADGRRLHVDVRRRVAWDDQEPRGEPKRGLIISGRARPYRGARFDTTELGDAWTEICAYGTAMQAVPVTDGAKYTAQQLGYGAGA